MITCDVFDSGIMPPQELMDRDAHFLETLDTRQLPLLHLYEWEGKSATYGHFAKPEEWLSLEALKQEGVRLGKRPTGGGILFHITDLAFSFLLPATHPAYSENTLENYRLVNEIAREAVNRFLKNSLSIDLLQKEEKPAAASCERFCMAKPTKYDLIIQGRKVGGAAQRRTKKGFLHQGTLSLGRLPESFLKKVLLPGNELLEEETSKVTFPLLGETWTESDLQAAKEELKRHLSDVSRSQVTRH